MPFLRRVFPGVLRAAGVVPVGFFLAVVGVAAIRSVTPPPGVMVLEPNTICSKFLKASGVLFSLAASITDL